MAEVDDETMEQLRKEMGEAVKIDVPEDMIEVRAQLDENGVATVAVPGGAAVAMVLKLVLNTERGGAHTRSYMSRRE